METSNVESDIEMNIKDSVLPLNFRYTAAWNEINVRIQLRQHALTAYTTWCLAILGFVASTEVNNCRFLYFLPFLSLLFVFLVRMHEEMIENLYQFLRRAESLDSMTGRMAAAFPSYNWDEIHRVNVLKSRQSNDYVIVGIIVIVHIAAFILLSNKFNIFSFEAFILLLNKFDTFSFIDYGLLLFSGCVFIYSIKIPLKFKFIRYRDLKSDPEHYAMIKNRPRSDIVDDGVWNNTSKFD